MTTVAATESRYLTQKAMKKTVYMPHAERGGQGVEAPGFGEAAASRALRVVLAPPERGQHDAEVDDHEDGEQARDENDNAGVIGAGVVASDERYRGRW